MKNFINSVCKWNDENSRYMLALAIVLAGAIIFAAWASRGSENASAIFLILVTASSSIFFIGQNKGDDNQNNLK